MRIRTGLELFLPGRASYDGCRVDEANARENHSHPTYGNEVVEVLVAVQFNAVGHSTAALPRQPYF
jgi:hypothetical protein